jgi:hypothetical protein
MYRRQAIGKVEHGGLHLMLWFGAVVVSGCHIQDPVIHELQLSTDTTCNVFVCQRQNEMRTHFGCSLGTLQVVT